MHIIINGTLDIKFETSYSVDSFYEMVYTFWWTSITGNVENPWIILTWNTKQY